jgi:hypothetical protein
MVSAKSIEGEVMHIQSETVTTDLNAPLESAEFKPLPLTADVIFPTNPLPVPPAIPDAHRAVIKGVEARHYNNEKETVSIVVHLTSLDNPALETEFQVFVPKLFAENIKVDPSTLPDEPGNKQRTVYRMHVSSEDGRATLQKLRRLASDAQRTIESVGITKASTNIDEFAENHSKLLTGLEVVFFRDVDSGNPEFANRLRVKGIVSMAQVEKKPKLLKKYVKAWEEPLQ